MNEDSGDDAEDATSHERDGSDADGGVHEGQGTDEDPAPEGSTEEEGTADLAVDGQQLSDLLVALDGAVADHAAVDEHVGQALVEDVVEPDTVTVDDVFRKHIEDADPGTLAGALAVLGDALCDSDVALTEERERAEDLESRLRRKQAEFKNYKKRQQKRMEEEKQRATEDLVERLLDVRDNLQRALDQEGDADIRGGVESTLDQFDRQLDRENVEPIEPAPGDGVDPVRHEVLATVSSEHPEDAIAGVHRPGYEMAGKVLRPAQVTVSHGPDDAETETDSATSE